MTIVVLGLLGLAIPLAVIPALHGGKALTVLTGSMKPTHNPGDVVVVYPVDSFEEIELGDVVTFMPKPEDPTLVTHRAVDWALGPEGEKLLITQGDANNVADEPLKEKQIRAKVAYAVPWVGNVLQYGNEFGKPLLIVAVAIGLIAYSIYAMVTSHTVGRSRASRKAAAQHASPAPSERPRIPWRPLSTGSDQMV
jgi:signal peptidase